MSRTFAYSGLLILFAHFAHGEEVGAKGHWGDFTGRIVYEGKPPVARMILAIGGPPLADESLMVNADNGGIANVVVTLVPSKHAILPVHPSYEAGGAGKATVDLQVVAPRRYDPHITLLQTTQSLQILNNLPTAANPKVDSLKNGRVNPLLEAGRSVQFRFLHADTVPTLASDNIHPWMKGYIAIVDHPYVAKTDGNGEFTIKNLPAGKLTFRFWHEQAGWIQRVKHKGVVEDWAKGKIEIDIKPDKQNDLGDVLVDPELFQPR